MKLGTHIRLGDGREGTVIYNGLEGVGIKWGIHYPDPEDFNGTTGGLFAEEIPKDWPWIPDALLRAPWGCNAKYGWPDEQCVGDNYEVIGI
jgi:hypothetical protein